MMAEPSPKAGTSHPTWWVRFGVVTVVFLVLIVAAIVFWPRATVDPEMLRQRASEAIRAGRWQDAETILASIRAPQPGDWLLRAQVAHAAKHDQDVPAFLGHVGSEQLSLAAQAALLAGELAQNVHHAKEMEEALARAIRLDPSLVPARRLLVFLYGAQERRVELMEQFSALAELSPTFDVVLHWSLSHGETGEAADLKPALEKFVAADPSDRWSRIGLARVERRLTQLDLALSVLAPLPADDPDARAIRARIALEQGDVREADRLLSAGPEEHLDLALLRGRRALAKRDGASAVKNYRTALRLDRNQFDALNGLDQALRLMGNQEESAKIHRRVLAHQALRDLLAKASTATVLSLEMFRQLGSASEAAGYDSEARAWYRLIVAADPLDSAAQKAIFRLNAREKLGASP